MVKNGILEIKGATTTTTDISIVRLNDSLINLKRKKLTKKSLILPAGSYEVTAKYNDGTVLSKNLIVKPFFQKVSSNFSKPSQAKTVQVAAGIGQKLSFDGNDIYSIDTIGTQKHSSNPFGGTDIYISNMSTSNGRYYTYMSGKFLTPDYLDPDYDQAVRVAVFDAKNNLTTPLAHRQDVSINSYIYTLPDSLKILIYDADSKLYYLYADNNANPENISLQTKPAMGNIQPMIAVTKNIIAVMSGADYKTYSPNDKTDNPRLNYTIDTYRYNGEKLSSYALVGSPQVSSLSLSDAGDFIAFGTDEGLSVYSLEQNNKLKRQFVATTAKDSSFGWIDNTHLYYTQDMESLQMLSMNKDEIGAESRSLFSSKRMRISEVQNNNNNIYISSYYKDDPTQTRFLQKNEPFIVSSSNQERLFDFLPYNSKYYSLGTTNEKIYIKFNRNAYIDNIDFQNELADAQEIITKNNLGTQISTDFTYIPQH